MADSIDAGGRASSFGQQKPKGNKLQQESDTHEAREKRILLYTQRACQFPDADSSPRRLGENGRPINIFTGLEYLPDELDGQLFEDE